MQQAGSARAAEWRAHWPLVLAAFAGVSLPSIAVNSMGLFIAPIQAEFGWNRTLAAAGITVVGLLVVPFSPLVGALVDRWGSRRIALPGVVLTGTSLALLGTAHGSSGEWFLLWSLVGLANLLISPTVWMAAIAGTFTAARGSALALSLAGSSFTSAVAPPVAHYLIAAHGWRMAYLLLGLVWALPVLVLVALLFFDAHDRTRKARAAAARGATPATATPAAQLAAPLDGLSIPQAVRSLPLWRIGLATLITMTLSTAMLVHKVPILTEVGVDRATAAWLAGLGGLAAIAGKLVTGWLTDRFDAGLVGGITLATSALAFVFLLEQFRTPALIVGSMVIIGYGGGTKLQICAHLTGVYGGLRNYGKIFGVMAGLVSLAAGVGPVLSGLAYDLAGSYSPVIVAGTIGNAISALLLIRLGTPPRWRKPLAQAEEPGFSGPVPA
ncbi:MFS transporter [Novosphingobium bradum]|uniref:MFS transporter n=1 Tax=Novosphingobium bradum TaxID=1737444 RepID=A0ABV7IJE6_9SPHN